MNNSHRGPAPEPRAIVWFRRDLRTGDHEPLAAALESADEVVPLFVRDPRLLDPESAGQRRVARLDAALAALDRDLRARGGRLVIRTGDPAEVVPAVAREVGATVVHAQRDHTPFARARDGRVGRLVDLRLHPGQLAVEPERLGERRVFSAFHRAWMPLASAGGALPSPARVRVPPIAGERSPRVVPRGEREVTDRLAAVASAPVEPRAERLDGAGSLRLSADLHLGTVSPRQVLAFLDDPDVARRLAWRDWAFHLLAFHPEARRLELDVRRRELAWRNDPDGFGAWAAGRTGYPTVDAAMRQLAAEGWISNRARLVAASFLAKDLRLDWRLGEAHFRRELEDGDVTVNVMNWQWAASVGSDRAPYVRILNPVVQGERFDPDGSWVRRWIPELAAVPDRFVHRPWASPAGAAAGYPPPIVDHAAARLETLAAFRAADERAGRSSPSRRDRYHR